MPAIVLRGRARGVGAVLIGTNFAAGAGTTLAMTLTQSVGVGDKIFVVMGWAAANAAESVSFVDSGGNTYTLSIRKCTTVGQGVGLACATCTTALTAGVSTITGTPSVGHTGRVIGAFKIPASFMPAAIAGDVQNSTNGNSTSSSGGSVTPSRPYDLIVMADYVSAAGFTRTPAAGYTKIIEVDDGAGGGIGVQISTEMRGDVVAQNPAFALGFALGWAGVNEGYLGTGSSGNIVAPNLAVAQNAAF